MNSKLEKIQETEKKNLLANDRMYKTQPHQEKFYKLNSMKELF